MRFAASQRELADSGVQIAIGRAQLRSANERALDAETRAGKLTAKLAELSTELLDVKSPRTSISPDISSSTDSERTAELHRLFGQIWTRRSEREPAATVVVPAYEKADYTIRCLRSIAVNWSYDVNAEIVIIDDCSPDGSGRQFIGIPGVSLLFNGTNIGYLRSSNRGAAFARTPYVCFLNNDTEVEPGWLDHLVRAAESDAGIGAVGSKLIYPDGRLQEAGSIIWSDASGWNYGRGADPTNSAYNYIREVDYCSAASLLVRTDLLRRLGGFDERYAPAYYEDADLCFEIRRCGYRVIYEPRSEVIHYEGISSGTDITSGAKRYQEVNRATFAAKWSAELARQHQPSPDNVEAAKSRKSCAGSILVIDTYVPLHDREAGSNRLFKIVKIMVELNYHVIFMPENQAVIEPYTTDIMRLGVEIMHRRERGGSSEEAFRAALPRTDIAWISRPELCQKYAPLVRAYSSAPILYDTVDLHYMRERRRAELECSGDESWKTTQELELACAQTADATIAVTHQERSELLRQGVAEVFVIPTIHDIEEHAGFGFDGRRGLLFIGGYGHTPNVDAVVWLCEEIMPIVWTVRPDIAVTLLGNNPPESVRQLESDRVLVTGYVADVGPFFEEARVFVAPLRYGAGMKGKIGHALSYGLPVITTQVGVEGYDLVDGLNCRIADDAASFAAAILDLYIDRERWAAYNRSSLDVIAAIGSGAVSVTLAAIFEAFAARREERSQRARSIRDECAQERRAEPATYA